MKLSGLFFCCVSFFYLKKSNTIGAFYRKKSLCIFFIFLAQCLFVLTAKAEYPDNIETAEPIFKYYPRCCVDSGFNSAEAAFAAIKAIWDQNDIIPPDISVTRTASNLHPWRPDYYLSFNGRPTQYVSARTDCYDGDCTTQPDAGPGVSMTVQCPADVLKVGTSEYRFQLVIKNDSGSLNREVACERILPFVAVLSESSPPPQCPVGNPIDPSSGAKIQNEIDVQATGVNRIHFERTYTNSNKKIGGHWYNTYGKSLSVMEDEYGSGIREQGPPQTTRSATCSSGWTDISSRINDSWAQGASSRWVEDTSTCEIVQNGRVVNQLAILIYPPFKRTRIPGYIQLTRENGAILSFYQTGPQTYSGFNGTPGVLKKLESDPEWQFITGSGDIENYSNGKLVSVISTNGGKQELFYAATGKLARVKDSTGRELLFAYTGNHLTSLTVDGTKTTSYAYNDAGLISRVTRPDSTERIYHYEDTRFPTALTGITDERGIRYATWAYDEKGRAISSEHAGGIEKTLLAFNTDGSTTVTNALNKKTIYRFTHTVGGLKVIKVEGQPTANCAGANQDYTYTPKGWVESKTDWKGIKTVYTYDYSGREISRIEAFGTTEARKITTEWHLTLHVKTKVTEPGKETVYHYDDNGRLVNQSTRSLVTE